MPKLIVDSLDAVPEALRGEYEAKDGKFFLKVDDLEEHPSTAGLRSAVSKERQRADAAEKARRTWESLGKTPEEIAALLAAKEQEDHDKLKKKGDFDSLLAQHQDKWSKREKELQDERDSALTNERNAVVNGQLAAELAKAKATDDGLVFLPGALAKRVSVETVDGKRVVKVTNEDGSAMAGSGAGGVATIADLVKEAVTKHPSLFQGSGAGGSGKPPGGNPPGGDGVTSKRQFKSEKERSAWVDKHGFDAYQALPD